MKAKIQQPVKQVVKVNNSGGTLITSSPITLKNQISELTSIEDIRDVDEIDVVTGATLVYNSYNDKYEIKPLTFNDVQGDLDGGTF